MFSPCSANFIAAAILPELISAKIERIDNALQDIKFQQQLGVLRVNGRIARHIVYRQPAGALRKISDSFQFQTAIQTVVQDEMPSLETELVQESFFHHPRTGRLEQTFLLKLREKETGPIGAEKVWVSITARQSIESGNHSACGRIELDLPEQNCEPLNFSGGIRFSDNQCAWLTGILFGTVRCCNAGGVLVEHSLEKEIDFIDAVKPHHQAHQELIWTGNITSYSFFQPSNGSRWNLAIKVDYQWDVVEPKNICCLSVCDESRPDGLVIQSLTEVTKCHHQISRDLFLPVELKPTEILCTIENHQEKQSRNGFILSADFNIEVYGIGWNQQETYSVFRYELIEWIPAPVEINWNGHLHFNSTLLPIVGPFSSDSHGVSLMVFFEYQGVISRSEFYRVDRTGGGGGGGTDFLVKSLQGRREFDLMGENAIDLSPRDVTKIEDISVYLSYCRGIPEKGWLKVDGLLEVSVSYIDIYQEYRCKIFNLPINNVFDWDETDSHFEALCYGTVESSMMMQLDGKYSFSYLLRIECTLLKNERVELTLFSEQKPDNNRTDETSALPGTPKAPRQGRLDLQLQELLLFLRSAPVEITGKNLMLTDISCNIIGHRLLIAGVQEWSLHFRNRCGTNETKKYQIPFWRYFPVPSPSGDNPKTFRLSHRILEYDAALIKKSLFSPQRGRLTVRFEITFSEDDGS